MAYVVDWAGTREIFIPVDDLVPLGSGVYNLEMSSFLEEVRRLEADFTQGLGWPQILEHTGSATLAGITYAPRDEIVNGYNVTFDPIATRVNLVGADNNIVDVLNANGVTVVPGNSAGSTSPGFTPTDKENLTLIHDLLGNVEGPFNVRDALRIILASTSGKASGAQTNSMAFRDVADTKDRIDATVDQFGNRLNVVLDPTD